LTPQDLKLGVTDALNALLEPIRQEFANRADFQQAFELAYPRPDKKVKKAKDKGSRYPGNVKANKQDGAVVDGILHSSVIEQGAGSRGSNERQVQSAGKDVEDALNKLSVSDTPK
jgi:hypothetical protein